MFEQTDLIVDVEHGEIGFQLHQFGVEAQDASADGVERAEPRHAFDRLAEHLAKPELHLARGLVGESHRQDFLRPRPALAQYVGDAGGQHAGLAGAGAGQNQHGPVQRHDRVALLGIEPGEILRGRRGARTRSNAASHRLVLGNAVMGQLTGFGHANRLVPRWHRGALKGSLVSRG